MRKAKSHHDGTGSIFARGPRGILYLSLTVNGKTRMMSTGTTVPKEAERFRQRELNKLERNEPVGPDRVTVDELLDDLMEYTRDRKQAQLKIRQYIVDKNLRPFFGTMKAVNVTTDLLKRYRQKRLRDGVTDATVNREFASLRKAFALGRIVTPPKVLIVPYFPMVSEKDRVRTGFLASASYTKLRDALPPYLKALYACAYWTGSRRSELLRLQWPQVDLAGRTITMHSNETKNGHPRIVPIVAGDMERYLREAYEIREALFPDFPWVFYRTDGVVSDSPRWNHDEEVEQHLEVVRLLQRRQLTTVDAAQDLYISETYVRKLVSLLESAGETAVKTLINTVLRNSLTSPKRIGNFSTAWRTACAEARVPDLNFHDLRRSAVNVMRKAGIPREIRMAIAGHKTDSMHLRYSIMDDADVSEAGALLSSYAARERASVASLDTRWNGGERSIPIGAKEETRYQVI